jgi:hypothetical protein
MFNLAVIMKRGFLIIALMLSVIYTAIEVRARELEYILAHEVIQTPKIIEIKNTAPIS